MATPTKPNSRVGTYVLKTFKDESFRGQPGTVFESELGGPRKKYC